MFALIPKRRAFSLVELVVVIVIIGILAAMAIPRLSRGSAGASSASLAGNLAIVRNAINMYAAEHNNKFPGDGGADMVAQLTTYTSATGATNASKTAVYKFGPYLVAIPPCPVGNAANPSDVLIDTTNSPPTVNTTGGEGWVYNPTTGEFIANTNDTDETGKAYSAY
ncbi:MAG: prepilin-type N-terminal cleavage/methylation domain-containing protein [Planctomycetota bacterium]|nr:MAG: prepilin-type N-terminal cleavage/methylation domain-containing protein [Planctomycetota bacterium]